MLVIPQPDEIIISPQLPEPARVVIAYPEGSGVRVKAFLVNENQFYDRLFQPGDFTIRRVGFTADGERFRLAALAERIRAAAQYDPHFAVNTAQIDPLPHQIDAVYNHLLKSPRIRFLLADDPGAGKTIMAGLLLKELQHRGAVERVLIVTPANLTMQWQDELRDRFAEDFTVIRGEQLRALPGSEIWEQNPRSIVSIDLAKRDDTRSTFEGVQWDLVIVDEAHRMAAYRYGQKVDRTQAYQLGELLSERADNFLLLTATPHRGSPENFRLFLALLDRDLFETNAPLAEILRQSDMPIFLRRLKEAMVHFDGRPIFPPRHVDTVTYELTGIEYDLYEAVSDYVSRRFQRAEAIADDRTRRNVGLALAILQRRLASSVRAIRASLARREEKLRGQLEALTTGPPDQIREPIIAFGSLDFDEEPDDEVERWEEEDRALGIPAVEATARELRFEIDEVHTLYELALSAERAADDPETSERKLAELRMVLQGPLVDGKNFWELDEKLLIFTENKDTLDYLVERVHSWGLRTASIYGGMDQDERRRQQARFATPNDEGGAHVMVATEAAGEGINLQFCRLMVNYDIPWNPNRLEQRMGRIHRYGQEHSVQIFNLVAANTREGQVLQRIFEKLEAMRNDLGRENVYDIVSDLLTASDLAALFQQAILKRESLVDIQARVSQTVDANERQRRMAAALIEALATNQMSPDALTDIREQVRTANEQRLVPEYIERFAVTAFRSLARDNGSRAELRPRAADPGVWQVENVPHFMRIAAPAGYSIRHSYTHIVFSKDLRKKYPSAELVTPGHPLFEALIRLVGRHYADALTSGARFGAPKSEQGLFWLLETTVKDGTGDIAGKQLVGVHQHPDGSLASLDPLALLDVAPISGTVDGPPDLPDPLPALARTPHVIEEWTRETVLGPYLREHQDRRTHEANVRETYLERSLNSLIADQTAKILTYQFDPNAQRDPSQFDIGLRTLEQRLDMYKTRLAARMEQSSRLRSLGADPPRVVGVCALVDAPVVIDFDDETTDPDTEAVAMAVSIAYERDHGREPEDVAASNLGFDVRSRGVGELRYIEVKGRKGTGAVLLTTNEWIKAARFGKQYWLYVVYDCDTTQPHLVRVQDPAANLNVAENVLETTRFRVNSGDILRVGKA